MNFSPRSINQKYEELYNRFVMARRILKFSGCTFTTLLVKVQFSHSPGRSIGSYIYVKKFPNPNPNPSLPLDRIRHCSADFEMLLATSLSSLSPCSQLLYTSCSEASSLVLSALSSVATVRSSLPSDRGTPPSRSGTFNHSS